MAQVSQHRQPAVRSIPATAPLRGPPEHPQRRPHTVAGIIHALTLLVIILRPRHWRNSSAGNLERGADGGGLQHGRVAPLMRLAKCPRAIRSFPGHFALTVLIDLTVAVQVGMVLAPCSSSTDSEPPRSLRLTNHRNRGPAPFAHRQTDSRGVLIYRCRRVFFRRGGQTGNRAQAGPARAGHSDFAYAQGAGDGRTGLMPRRSPRKTSRQGNT